MEVRKMREDDTQYAMRDRRTEEGGLKKGTKGGREEEVGGKGE